MATPPGINQLDPGDFPALPDKEKLVRALNPFMGATAAALRAGLTFRENFAGHIKVLEVTCPDDWVSVSYDADWADFGGAQQAFQTRKTPDGTVKIRGSFKWTGGGLPAAGTRISALSGPLVTPAREVLVVLAESPATAGSLSIRPTGLYYESGPVAAISVSGLEWCAADRVPPAWATPVDFALPDSFTAKPGAVLVLRCEETSSGLPVASVSVDGWKLASPRAEESRQVVRLQRINGLAPGYSYRLTLLVLPE